MHLALQCNPVMTVRGCGYRDFTGGQYGEDEKSSAPQNRRKKDRAQTRYCD
jgi:hypothetical protein